MPVSKSDVVFFNKDLDIKSLDDLLRVTEQDWIERLRKSLEDNDRVSTGSLQSSIRAEIETSPSYVKFRIIGNKYWEVVDKGRGKGKKMPPLNSMIQFISNRNSTLKPVFERIKYYQSLKLDAKLRKTPMVDDKAYKSLAFIIGRSISKNGIKPTNFVSEAIGDEQIIKFKKDIKAAFKKGLLKK